MDTILKRLERDDPYNKLERKFFDFHYENPEVYRIFLHYTEEAFKVRNRYSAHDIMSRVRWWVHIETHSKDSFKISNNHSAYYARLLMCRHPKFSKLFVTHHTDSDNGNK